ncbi:hypothetical protein HNR00_000634 [Methylorubrum rhodinum]|uniref:Phage-Barnase-EndoU-ColicinE5/D-RelE like nuclease 3 domain-containing protein n=1 Tax=Methylorubrum rhodinum TaxID=29428 RepID=A0A840ZFI1_9HYPH|nr:hypothetical protein [Methylorubrum rhodinum]MBB5755938.1 hypothetical protein [Methylorubrum rhodinum]
MDFEHLLGLHTGTYHHSLAITEISPPIARSLSANVTTVLLSADTIRKQLKHHRELPISAYRYVRNALVMGEYRQDSPRSAIVLYTHNVEPYQNFRVYLKATQSGDEIYLLSFLIMRDRDLKREQRKPFPVIRPHLETRKGAEAP